MLKKKGNRSREEIGAFVILLCLSNKPIPKWTKQEKSEIGPPNCIYSYPECVLDYIRQLASRNIVGETWEDAYKVSFTDFWSSVDLPDLENIKL